MNNKKVYYIPPKLNRSYQLGGFTVMELILFFAMDKSEDLSKNKIFWKKMPEQYAVISDANLKDRSELITVMNNFLLRSFIEFDIYTFEQEVKMLYEKQKGAK